MENRLPPSTEQAKEEAFRSFSDAFVHEEPDLMELISAAMNATRTSKQTLTDAGNLLDYLLPSLFASGFRAGFQAAVLAFQEGRLTVDPLQKRPRRVN
jgi:hypothetical protein